MIELTRFDGTQFYVNADLIEFIETTPDTIVSLIDHKKLLVRETAEDVVRLVLDYHMRIGSLPPVAATAYLRWFGPRKDEAEDNHGAATLKEDSH